MNRVAHIHIKDPSCRPNPGRPCCYWAVFLKQRSCKARSLVCGDLGPSPASFTDRSYCFWPINAGCFSLCPLAQKPLKMNCAGFNWADCKKLEHLHKTTARV